MKSTFTYHCFVDLIELKHVDFDLTSAVSTHLWLILHTFEIDACNT